MADEFITLREASKYSGYHSDYISSLIREGVLDGRKVGRSWVTTYSAIDKYLKFRNKKENSYFKKEIKTPKRIFYLQPTFIFFSAVFVFVLVATLSTLLSERGSLEFDAENMIKTHISDDLNSAVEIISVYGE